MVLADPAVVTEADWRWLRQVAVHGPRSFMAIPFPRPIRRRYRVVTNRHALDKRAVLAPQIIEERLATLESRLASRQSSVLDF